ncbi:MAG: hypothetical protein ACTSUK_03935 [Promethearchaeota archaeon]
MQDNLEELIKALKERAETEIDCDEDCRTCEYLPDCIRGIRMAIGDIAGILAMVLEKVKKIADLLLSESEREIPDYYG